MAAVLTATKRSTEDRVERRRVLCRVEIVATPSGMSDYERNAWQALLDEAAKHRRPSGGFSGWVRGINQRTQATARAVVDRVPGADTTLDAVDAAITKAMAGVYTVLVERGLNSVAPAGIIAMFADAGAQVGCYDDVRRLDLAVCDESVPRRKERYVALAATEGAASSLVVTGGVVSAVAGSSAEQAAALASLSRLTQQLMRRTIRRQLRQRQLIAVAQRVFAALGFLLARSKLAQVIPVLGAVLNGGFNARIAQQTFERAQRVYRLRFLTEKYDLDPARWAPAVIHGETVGVPLVDEVLEAELAAEPGDQ